MTPGQQRAIGVSNKLPLTVPFAQESGASTLFIDKAAGCLKRFWTLKITKKFKTNALS